MSGDLAGPLGFEVTLEDVHGNVSPSTALTDDKFVPLELRVDSTPPRIDPAQAPALDLAVVGIEDPQGANPLFAPAA